MKLLEPYYRINPAAGVSITLLPSGGADISACSLSAKGNQLSIDKKLVNIQSVEALTQHFQPKIAMALNISGKSILHKQIESISTVDQGNFNKILPNANIDD